MKKLTASEALGKLAEISKAEEIRAILEGSTVKALREVAKFMGLKVKSSMRKAVLVDAMNVQLIARVNKNVENADTASAVEPLTVEEMKAAYDELNVNGRIFVRICDMRKKINRSREEFDGMIKTLRNSGKISLHIGDASLMNIEEVKACFYDENGFRMGTMVWKAA